MLKYLIDVTEQLLIPAVITGLLLAWVTMTGGSGGRRVFTAGVLAGVLAAIVMAVMKNTTNKIATGLWNIRIFTAALAALILLLVFFGKRLRTRLGKAGTGAMAGLAAILEFLLLFYALPDVLAYPFNFSLNGDSVFSTAFIYRFLGYLGGLILVFLAGLAAQKSGRRMHEGGLRAVTTAVLVINGLYQASMLIQLLLSRRFITAASPAYKTLFRIAKFTSNHSRLYLYGVMLAALAVPLTLWIRSFHVSEPYENSAQHRKIRAKWRNIRRWATTMLACFLVCLLVLTWLSWLNSRGVELSPAEDCEIRDGAVYVPLEQVSDEHLHRFEYTTEHGITVRFIVIKKPNASSYGVGLDACDICGQTGYFERNGQIVCKLCDVVMNVNTIGFKGGCNPIVIDYRIDGGYIIVPFETLVEHENEFK